MKPANKNAAYICDVRLRENKPWHRSPADAERNCRRFWKRQASKAQRYRPAVVSPVAIMEHYEDFYDYADHYSEWLHYV